jgi:hypothetical protein
MVVRLEGENNCLTNKSLKPGQPRLHLVQQALQKSVRKLIAVTRVRKYTKTL